MKGTRGLQSLEESNSDVFSSLPAYHGLNNSAWQWGNQPVTAGIMLPPTSQSQQPASESSQMKTTDRKRRRTHDASSETSQPNQTIHDPSLNPRSSPRPDFATPAHAAIISPQPGTGGDSSDAPTFTQNPLSPSFSFSPWATNLSIAPGGGLDTGQAGGFDNLFSLPQTFDHQTPGGMSANGSTHTEGDKDPFLSLLEQLAENEHSRGGPSDLDFFLSGQG